MAAILQILPNATTIMYLITTSGAGSITSPAGYSKVRVEAIGGGGNGAGTGGNRAGGGGGAYAGAFNLNIASPGSTVVYYSVGTAGTSSWVNVGTNSSPASSSNGCAAVAGGNATSGTAGAGGSAASCVGATAFSGGNGTTGTGAVGGGGAGSNEPASGQTAGRLSLIHI